MKRTTKKNKYLGTSFIAFYLTFGSTLVIPGDAKKPGYTTSISPYNTLIEEDTPSRKNTPFDERTQNIYGVLNSSSKRIEFKKGYNQRSIESLI